LRKIRLKVETHNHFYSTKMRLLESDLEVKK